MRTPSAIVILVFGLLVAVACSSAAAAPGAAGRGAAARGTAANAAGPGAANHTSNWAVLVCTSAYWYNYRHMANTLSIYRTVRRLGIPDSNIILMLADDVSCNARNKYPAEVFNDESHRLDVYGQDVEVDYRGYEVTVENFMRVLTGRHDAAVPRAKRMLSDEGSNVLIFITGHGGNEFIKFQDQQELMAADLADAVAQMHQKGRYKQIVLMVETCQAATLYSRIKSPNVLAMASSLKGESSYSYLTDYDIGLSLVDRFTYQTLEFFERVETHSRATLQQLFDTYTFEHMESHFGSSTENFPRPLASVRVTEFFGHVTAVTQLAGSYPYDGVGDSAAAAAAAAAARSAGKAEEREEEVQGSGTCGGGGGAGTCAAAEGGGRRPLSAALVKGRVRSGGGSSGSGGGSGGVGAAPLDGVALGGLAALAAAAAAASAAWASRQAGEAR